MNEASKLRIRLAESLTAVYASHPDVRAIILGGSTARGTAHKQSDIDLGLFWTRIPNAQERDNLMIQVGGQLDRRVENHYRYSTGNPRCQGCIEIIDIQPKSDSSRFRLDLEHETVAGTVQVLSDVVDQFDPSLEKQEVLSVIENGNVLYGHDLVDQWREKTGSYPNELANKMVIHNLLGIGADLLNQVPYVGSQDWFCLYEGFLDIGRRLLLTLMGLNRVWAFTDNPDFKGLKSFAGGLVLQPVNFVGRLGQFLQSNATVCILGLADLIEEELALVENHLPTIDITSERDTIKQVRDKTTREINL